jgi:hypothetical protein
MKHLVSNKGYYYKINKVGDKKRISQKEFINHKGGNNEDVQQYKKIASYKSTLDNFEDQINNANTDDEIKNLTQTLLQLHKSNKIHRNSGSLTNTNLFIKGAVDNTLIGNLFERKRELILKALQKIKDKKISNTNLNNKLEELVSQVKQNSQLETQSNKLENSVYSNTTDTDTSTDSDGESAYTVSSNGSLMTIDNTGDDGVGVDDDVNTVGDGDTDTDVNTDTAIDGVADPVSTAADTAIDGVADPVSTAADTVGVSAPAAINGVADPVSTVADPVGDGDADTVAAGIDGVADPVSADTDPVSADTVAAAIDGVAPVGDGDADTVDAAIDGDVSVDDDENRFLKAGIFSVFVAVITGISAGI